MTEINSKINFTEILPTPIENNDEFVQNYYAEEEKKKKQLILFRRQKAYEALA